MLTLDKVYFAYPGSEPVLRGLDLTIRKGDRHILTGTSGCGKSTLLRLLANLIAPQSGNIQFEGDTPPRIGFVRQKPENQLVAGTVFDEIALGLEYRGWSAQQIEQRVQKVLEQTGLEGLERRAPSRLSGGQMQRLAFAAALALDPDLWLLDEPTAYLDPEGRRMLHELLAALPGETAVLWVASDPDEYTLTGSLLLMAGGRIHTSGPPEELFANRSLEKIGLAPPRLWSLTTGRLNETVDTGEKSQDAGRAKLPEFPPEQLTDVHSVPGTSARLCVKKVHVSRKEFLGEKRAVLHGIDLSLEPGEIAALLGLSGSGKSTLIEAVAGLLPVDHGEIDVGGDSPDRLFGRIGVVFQFPERGFFADTVLDEVAYGARNRGLSRRDARALASQALLALGLEDRDGFYQRSPFDVSGGEARRVALASVWVLRPILWLLDEPTAGLDEENAAAVGRMIRQEAARGCPVLIAGHDLDRFSDWAGRFLLLAEGKILRDGTAREWWASQQEPWPPPATVRALRMAGYDRFESIDLQSTVKALQQSGIRKDPVYDVKRSPGGERSNEDEARNP